LLLLVFSLPLTHLTDFFLVIFGVPAADAIPALLVPVLRIRIRRIHMFLGLPDPNSDTSIIKQK
jgi:hypothetical protein